MAANTVWQNALITAKVTTFKMPPWQDAAVASDPTDAISGLEREFCMIATAIGAGLPPFTKSAEGKLMKTEEKLARAAVDVLGDDSRQTIAKSAARAFLAREVTANEFMEILEVLPAADYREVCHSAQV